MHNRYLFAAGLFALIALVGCSGKPIAQVSGRAEFSDGSPLVGAVRTISFQPAEDSSAEIRKAAMGSIAEDGSFVMYTRKPGDGVIKGRYHVTFNVIKDPNYGGLLIPVRYAAPADTPFSVEITEDRDDLLFQLDKE